jgi:hypothetical protein
MAHVDLDINAAGPHEGLVELLGQVGRHDDNAAFLRGDPVEDVEKTG